MKRKLNGHTLPQPTPMSPENRTPEGRFAPGASGNPEGPPRAPRGSGGRWRTRAHDPGASPRPGARGRGGGPDRIRPSGGVPLRPARRARECWRWRELLPVRDARHIVSLGEGDSPLLPAPRLGALAGLKRLLLKDEGSNPISSFKARGISSAVSRALELGVRDVALPTAGNAGGALAAYAARAGLGAHVYMPVDAPDLNKKESGLYGAEVVLVRGLISDCGAWIRKRADQEGWFGTAGSTQG